MAEDKPKNEEKDEDENVIYVGKKPFMNYVTGAVMQFNSGADKVEVKARGKWISRAVDVAEVIRKRFVEDAELEDISIGSEQFEGDDGEDVRISSIEITLTK